MDGGGTGDDTEVPGGALCLGSGGKGLPGALVHRWHGAEGLGRDGDVAWELEV